MPEDTGRIFSPSSEFRKVGTILRLGSLVAGIDNHIADSEIRLLENLITQNEKLKETEKRSLHAYMHWRLNTSTNTAGLKKRLEVLNKSEKVAISHILVGVALADGKIDPAEIRQLEKNSTGSLALIKQWSQAIFTAFLPTDCRVRSRRKNSRLKVRLRRNRPRPFLLYRLIAIC